MTSISKIHASIGAFIFCILFFPSLFVFAQSSVSLSVSPTLFEMTANPTQEWASSVRVINPNPYDLTVYVEVVNFAPQGESGQGRFVPVEAGETAGRTLAEWIAFEQIEVTIPAEQTRELPFTIDVPEDAQPGGHFAALLVGTKPPQDSPNRSRVETSQVVTSLVFLRVSGDVREEGSVRSFRSLDTVLERPETTFEMRFENTGNVHILPQGEIRIMNMWGQERGVVPINRGTMFGNVLPESIRSFTFTWTGDWAISEIGRYTAVVTLAYGLEERNFASSETTFWVIPWKEVLLVVGSIVGFLLFMTWVIKLYIRRMLALAVANADPRLAGAVTSERRTVVRAPIERGMLDLRQRYATSETFGQKVMSTFGFVFQYKLFFVTMVVVIGFGSATVWFIQSASTSDRAYQVEVLSDSGANVTVSSEDVAYENLKPAADSAPEGASASSTPVAIINRSGKSGMAAAVRVFLEESDINVVSLDTDFGVVERNTVIVYDPLYLDDALAISRMINGALLSSFDGESAVPITIYVGSDFESGVQ